MLALSWKDPSRIVRLGRAQPPDRPQHGRPPSHGEQKRESWPGSPEARSANRARLPEISTSVRSQSANLRTMSLNISTPIHDCSNRIGLGPDGPGPHARVPFALNEGRFRAGMPPIPRSTDFILPKIEWPGRSVDDTRRYEGDGVGAAGESEVQLDPIRPMIRAYRGAVNIGVLDLAPQLRINEAIV